jgi:hypothetical protein
MGFATLLQQAAAADIRVLVQCAASVSTSRPHRKYRDMYVRSLNNKGEPIVHAGTDCLENQWEDQQLLNYRKLEVWDLLVSELKTLAQNYGVGGIYLNDAQSYPFVMAADTSELTRRDTDNEPHYSDREVGDASLRNRPTTTTHTQTHIHTHTETHTVA